MGAAQTVIAVVVFEISRPAVMHQNRPGTIVVIVVIGRAGYAVAWNDVDRIERFGAAFSVTSFDHDVAARAAVDPVVSGVHPDRDLIGVQHRHAEQPFNGCAFPIGQRMIQAHHPFHQRGLGV